MNKSLVFCSAIGKHLEFGLFSYATGYLGGYSMSWETSINRMILKFSNTLCSLTPSYEYYCFIRHAQPGAGF